MFETHLALWQIELLGGFRATSGDRTITRFRTHKTASLLAFLAFYNERAHAREVLQELLWPDDTLDAARNGLRVALNSLRKQLEPVGTEPGSVLYADRSRIELNPQLCTTDVAALKQTLNRATAGDPQAEIARLTAAVTLYRGELLPGFYDEWVLPERDRLSQQHAGALLELARLYTEAQDYRHALVFAQQAVAADPLNEDGQRRLIEVHIHLGNRAAAQQQYDALTRLLRVEMGSPPSAETRALATRLQLSTPTIISEKQLNLEAPLPAKPAKTPTPESAPVAEPSRDNAKPPAPLHTIPVVLTPFYGRRTEREQICRLMSPAGPDDTPLRVLTVTGPGGTGKTRIAIETARSLEPAYAQAGGRVIFVTLGEEMEGRRILEATAQAMGLPRSVTGEYRDAVVAALAAHSPALLVLDNLEQLTASGAPVVRSLLTAVPGLRLLLTSRRRLEIPGERELPLPLLPVPPSPAPSTADAAPPLEELSAYPSVQLFLHRAQASRADFALTARNAADIAAVCRALEGLPLALELAAARIWALTPAQMREQLAPTDSDGTTTNRFHLLATSRADKPERHRSLWAAISWSYSLLPPPLRHFFRQIAIFRDGWTLAAAQAVCDEPFASEYLTQLRAHSLLAVHESESLDEGEPRFFLLDSLREFVWDQQTPDARYALAQRHVAYFRSLADASRQKLRGEQQSLWLKLLDRESGNLRAALEWCLAQASHDHDAGEAGLQICDYLCQYWIRHGPLRESLQYVEALLAQTDANEPSVARAGAQNTAGMLHLTLGDYEPARQYFDRSLALYREQSDLSGLARVLSNRGILLSQTGDLRGGQAAQRESLQIRLQIGDRWGASACYLNIGASAQYLGDREEAIWAYENALPISREIGNRHGAGIGLLNLAHVARETGDYARAATLYEECLEIARVGDFEDNRIFALLNYGGLLSNTGDRDRAEAYLTEALTLSRQSDRLPLVGAALVDLGRIAVERGNYPHAKELLDEILHLPLERITFCSGLEAFAELAVGVGDWESATLLYSAASAIRDRNQSPVPEDVAASHEDTLTRIRTQLTPARFEELWQRGAAIDESQIRAIAKALQVPHR